MSDTDQAPEVTPEVTHEDITTPEVTTTTVTDKAKKGRPESKILIMASCGVVVVDGLTDATLPAAVGKLDFGSYTVRRYWDRTLTIVEQKKTAIKFG